MSDNTTMPKAGGAARSPQEVADAELLVQLGTDPEAWAQGLCKVLAAGLNVTLTAAWFYHAIEAGRKANPPADRELTASEQMRDRIADFVRTEIDRREDAGSTARRVRPALIAIEREIRRMPGRLAQAATDIERTAPCNS